MKKDIDSLSQQFLEMLKETLTKMKSRIEAANKQWESDNDEKLLKKFEEITNPGGQAAWTIMRNCFLKRGLLSLPQRYIGLHWLCNLLKMRQF